MDSDQIFCKLENLYATYLGVLIYSINILRISSLLNYFPSPHNKYEIEPCQVANMTGWDHIVCF